MTELRVVSWNMKVGRPHHQVLDGLAELIDAHHPDAVCLQEAKTYVGAIRDRFGHGQGGGWYVYAHNDWPESNGCPVMVRAKGREKLARGEGWNTLRTTKVWTGPQGGDHKGRTWTHVNVDGVRVMSLHRCTGGGDSNADAFREEANKLEDWIAGSGKPILIIGDHNCGVNAAYPGSSKLVAEATGSKLEWCEGDAGIDYAIRRELKGSVKRSKAYGSDHQALVFTVAS